MRTVTALSLILLLTLIGPKLSFAQPGPTSAPAEAVIASLDFTDSTLEEVINVLQTKVAGFQAQILRDPMVPEDYPRIRLKAQNLTANQVLTYLGRAYDIRWEQIPGMRETIYLVRVSYTDRMQSEMAERYNSQPRPAGGPQAKSVRVFPLAAVAPNTKTPLADVLSLVQAAIEQSGLPAPTLKLHEATQSLLATGDPQALMLIDGVLAALKPSDETLRRSYEEKLRDAQQQTRMLQIEMESRVRSAEVEKQRVQQSLEAQINELRVEVQRLKASAPRQ